jgi:hypothetical protein
MISSTPLGDDFFKFSIEPEYGLLLAIFYKNYYSILHIIASNFSWESALFFPLFPLHSDQDECLWMHTSKRMSNTGHFSHCRYHKWTQREQSLFTTTALAIFGGMCNLGPEIALYSDLHSSIIGQPKWNYLKVANYKDALTLKLINKYDINFVTESSSIVDVMIGYDTSPPSQGNSVA